MNSTLINSSNLSASCMPAFFLSDVYSITLTTIRITVAVFYFIWLILCIKRKELHSKKLAFLHNLNAIGIFYCILSIQLLLASTCDVYTEAMCTFQAFNLIFFSILSGYGLSALAIYRLACICYVDLDKKINRCSLLISISSVWIISIIFTLIQCFAFKSKFYFNNAVNGCLMDSSYTIWSFIFSIFMSAFLPNCLVLTAYFWGHYRMNILKMRTNSKKSMSPMRITVQLIIYIVMFEVNCVANLIIFYQTIYMRPIAPDYIIILIRILKWFHHFSPLALLYFHPVMLKKYEEWMKNF